MQLLNRAFGDVSGMNEILDEPRLVDDAPGAPDLVVRKGAIDFSGIGFWYTDGDAKTRVFDGFDLHIPAGQRVGLVGMSGAGKTALTKLLLRLSEIQEGHIFVDGQDIAACTHQSLRRQVAYVPQEALERLMAGRTCIVVAHRLSTVASLDRIMVLSDGRVAEDGPHAELVEAGGEYALLWNRQTGAYLE